MGRAGIKKKLTIIFCLLRKSNASAMVSGVRGMRGLESTKVAGFMILPSFSSSSTSNTSVESGGITGDTPSSP